MRIAASAAVAAAAAPLLACSDEPVGASSRPPGRPVRRSGSPLTGYKEKAVTVDEKLNSVEEITGYNNFYEFGTGRGSEALQRKPEDQPLDRQGRRPVQ